MPQEMFAGSRSRARRRPRCLWLPSAACAAAQRDDPTVARDADAHRGPLAGGAAALRRLGRLHREPGVDGVGLVRAPASLRWIGVALGVCVVPAVHWLLTALGPNVSETVLVKERHELVTSAGPVPMDPPSAVHHRYRALRRPRPDGVQLVHPRDGADRPRADSDRGGAARRACVCRAFRIEVPVQQRTGAMLPRVRSG